MEDKEMENILKCFYDEELVKLKTAETILKNKEKLYNKLEISENHSVWQRIIATLFSKDAIFNFSLGICTFVLCFCYYISFKYEQQKALVKPKFKFQIIAELSSPPSKEHARRSLEQIINFMKKRGEK